MVYKKYVKYKGKIFGPYYYESYRDNGKVKSSFLAGPTEIDSIFTKIKNNKRIIISLATTLAFTFLCIIIYAGILFILL
jgi:hypothetical protein